VIDLAAFGIEVDGERLFEVDGDLRAGLFEATVVGTGAVLMRADVFGRVPGPWFDVPPGGRNPTCVAESEDVHVCRLLREAGFSIWYDGSVVCDHVKLASIGQIYAAARDERFLVTTGRR